MRRYSSRTPLTTRSSYSELGVERLTNVLGRHAEMFRARDNPGNALGQTMHRRSRCAIFREHMRSALREALDSEGMSCWAKHCADPAPDRHTALRRFPKRRTQGVVSPTGRECQFRRGARIPHAVCQNTKLSKAMCKKCPAWRQGLVKIPHGGHLSRGKANDSRSGRKMSGLVPRFGGNLTRARRQFREKSTTPGAVGNVWTGAGAG